jgi:hypothetical protein
MAKLDKDNIVDIIETNLRDGEGGTSSQLSNDRALALDYYFMRQKPDGIQNGSQVIAGEVSAAVEATLANIMGAIRSDCIASFKPVGEQDENQAVMESQVVQNKVLAKGFLTFESAIKDALILRNGYVKVWVDEKEKVEAKTLYFPTKEDALLAIAALEGENAPNERIDVQPVKGKPNYLRIKKTTLTQEPRISAIPPENICYSANWETHNFDDVPFFAERHTEVRSNLIEAGYPKEIVNSLPAYSSVSDPLKDVRQRETSRVTNNTDPSLDVIEYYECYLLADSDGDGVAERHRVIYADGKILEDETVSPYVPYVTAIALLKQHSAQGMSMFDKLKHIQETNTGLTRALLNNVQVVNRPRVAYNEDEVDGDDLANPDPFAGIAVRGSRPVNELVQPIVIQDLTAGLLQNLEYQRTIRDELGGSALQIASSETSVGTNVGSQGLDRAYSAREMLVALMTENLVETLIKGVFLMFHKVMREYWIGALDTNISGIWQQTTPAEWLPRAEVDIKIGLSIGERQRKIQAMTQLINLELQLIAGNMKHLVDSKTFYNALIDWSRHNSLSNPERFFLNPDSEQSKQTLAQQQQQATQQTNEQKQLMLHALKLQEIEIANKKYIDELKISFEKWQTELQESVKLQIADATEVSKHMSEQKGREFEASRPQKVEKNEKSED